MNYVSKRHRKGRVWLRPQQLGFGGKWEGTLLPLRSVWQTPQPERDQALAGTQTHTHSRAEQWFLSHR